MYLCRLFPIENKAVFMSFFGKSYSDNPRAIYEEMLNENIDMKYIWLMKEDSVKIPNAIVVKPLSFRGLFHQATARLWIDNCRKSAWIVKRKGQYYIQTWRGGIGVKKAEKDTENVLSMEYIAGAKHDSEMANLFVSGSKWNTDKYRRSFWYSGEIIESGLPRSDVFYKEVERTDETIRKLYTIDDLDKIILYAPTFRADGGIDCYKMDFDRLIRAAQEKWGGRWKVMVRLHPNLLGMDKKMRYSKDVINVSNYPDINELISICDILITDYSSCMFDALNIEKNVILYAIDIEEYRRDRDTYFSMNSLPFPLAKDEDELIEIILNFNEENYVDQINNFKKEYRIFDDGRASERIVEKIRKELKIEPRSS